MVSTKTGNVTTTPPPSERYRFMAIRIWDPEKPRAGDVVSFGGEHWMGGAEFAKHCDFMASKSAAEKYMDFLQKHATWMDQKYGGKKNTIQPAGH